MLVKQLENIIPGTTYRMRTMRKGVGSLEWEMIPETKINMAAVSDNMGSKDKDIIMAKEN